MKQFGPKVCTFVIAALLFADSSPAQICTGDCDGNAQVAVNELVQGVTIALGEAPVSNCPAFDIDLSGDVSIGEIVAAVGFALEGCPIAATPIASSTPTASPTPLDGQLPPAEQNALLEWLQVAPHRSWRAESAAHSSLGPHFGRVRTFLNDAVIGSLEAGSSQHPSGSAIVKELYGSTGEQVRGWSVMIKVQDDTAGGDGWYWYENYGGIFAASTGASICTGCHSSNYRGLTNRDFVLTPFPLQ